MCIDVSGLTSTQIKGIICEYVLSKRDRNILYRRLVDGLTYEALAEAFDMSTSQIKRILKKWEWAFDKNR